MYVCSCTIECLYSSVGLSQSRSCVDQFLLCMSGYGSSLFGSSTYDAIFLASGGICLGIFAIIIIALILFSRRPDFLTFGTGSLADQTNTFIVWFVFVGTLLLVQCCGLALWRMFDQILIRSE